MSGFINGVTNYADWKRESSSKTYLARMGLIAAGIREFTDEVALVQAVKVSTMTGKLEGFYSVSTSVLMNPICQARARVEGSICQKCYAATTASRYSGLTDALETNHRILNGFLISESAWATLNWPTTNGYGRVESFGDVATVTCARNYLRIIKTHSWITFGVWTKNVGIWKAAMKLEGGKPGNMKFILSSRHINQPDPVSPEDRELIDHRFTVYTAEFAKENGVNINCGGRKCATCLNCYGNNDIFDIAELLK